MIWPEARRPYKWLSNLEKSLLGTQPQQVHSLQMGQVLPLCALRSKSRGKGFTLPPCLSVLLQRTALGVPQGGALRGYMAEWSRWVLKSGKFQQIVEVSLERDMAI